MLRIIQLIKNGSNPKLHSKLIITTLLDSQTLHDIVFLQFYKSAKEPYKKQKPKHISYYICALKHYRYIHTSKRKKLKKKQKGQNM